VEPALLQPSIHILYKLLAAISASIREQGTLKKINSISFIDQAYKQISYLSKHEDEYDQNQDCRSGMHQRIKKNGKILN